MPVCHRHASQPRAALTSAQRLRCLDMPADARGLAVRAPGSWPGHQHHLSCHPASLFRTQPDTDSLGRRRAVVSGRTGPFISEACTFSHRRGRGRGPDNSPSLTLPHSSMSLNSTRPHPGSQRQVCLDLISPTIQNLPVMPMTRLRAGPRTPACPRYVKALSHPPAHSHFCHARCQIVHPL